MMRGGKSPDLNRTSEGQPGEVREARLTVGFGMRLVLKSGLPPSSAILRFVWCVMAFRQAHSGPLEISSQTAVWAPFPHCHVLAPWIVLRPAARSCFSCRFGET